jgi:hypothetical protein
MVDLEIRRTATGFELVTDIGSKSCGESRTEYAVVNPSITEKQAKSMVSNGIASWAHGHELPRRCKCCGQLIPEV